MFNLRFNCTIPVFRIPSVPASLHPWPPFVTFTFCLITGSLSSGPQTTRTYTSVSYGFLVTSSLNYSSSARYTVTSIINGHQYTNVSSTPVVLTLSAPGAVNSSLGVPNDNNFTLLADTLQTTSDGGVAMTSSYSALDLFDGSLVKCVSGRCGRYAQLTVQLFNATSGITPCVLSSPPPVSPPVNTSTPAVATPVPSCLTLSTPSVTAGTTAFITFTDACALYSLSLAELEMYEVAAVCRFLPSGVLSPAVVHVNTSSGANLTSGATFVVQCPLPLLLSAGVYTVQLSLDGGASVPLSVLTPSSIAASTLTVTAAMNSSQSFSGFNVTSISQHPFNAAIDPLPSGFNRNDTLTFSWTASALPNSTHITLVLEVTFLQFNSTSARTAPIIVSQSALIIAAYLTRSQSPFTWTVPDLSVLVLQRLQLLPSQLLAFSVGAHYSQSSNSSLSIKPGGVSGVGFYDSAAFCQPTVCTVLGAVSGNTAGPLVVSALTSVASSISSLSGITSVLPLLQAAARLESAADALDAASSPQATAAHANASQAVQTTAESIAVYGAQLTGGSLYSLRASLTASLSGPLLSAGGASVDGGGVCTTLFGDVHLLTFDGVHYDFQGVGVYWLLQTPSLLYPQSGVSGFSLQMYLQPLSSNIQPGTPAAQAWAGVTYMAGVALQADSLCGIIQVIPRASPSPITGSYLDVLDAGVYVNVPYSTAGSTSSYQLSCGTMYYTARDTLVINTYNQYTVTVTALDGIARLSNLQVCVPSTAYSNTAGMLGSWDGNPYNDFVSQGVDYYALYPGNVASTTIVAGSSGPNDAAGYTAGVSWMVQPLDSFYISLSAPQVGCNITEDDSAVFTSVCLLGGQRQSTNLLIHDVNVSSILLSFNIARLPYVPVTWPNSTLQRQAISLCIAATGGQSVNSTAVVDCLADAYFSNSTAIATTPTTIVTAQQLVQTVAPPTLTLLSLTLTQATLSVSGASVSAKSGGVCTQLLFAAVINSTAAVQCVYVVQLSVGGGGAAFTPLNLSTAQVTGSDLLVFTLPLSNLQSGVVYSVRASLEVILSSSPVAAMTDYSSLSLFIPTVQSASICVMTYGLPGNQDYPWSSATLVNFFYNSTTIVSAAGTAVSILNGTGTRTYTNRFGTSFSTPLTASSPTTAPINLLYLNSVYPVDATGLSFNLSTMVQLPGVGPSLVSLLTLHNSTSGAVIEGASSLVDAQAEAFLSTVPWLRQRHHRGLQHQQPGCQLWRLSSPSDIHQWSALSYPAHHLQRCNTLLLLLFHQ